MRRESQHEKTARGAVDAPQEKTRHPRLIRTPSLVLLRNLLLSRPRADRASSKALREENPNKQALPTVVRQKKGKRKSSALQERIEVDIADLENRRRQIAQSVKEKVKESYGFLPDKRRSAKQNALVILTKGKVVLFLSSN